jgi:hypothetical protein
MANAVRSTLHLASVEWARTISCTSGTSGTSLALPRSLIIYCCSPLSFVLSSRLRCLSPRSHPTCTSQPHTRTRWNRCSCIPYPTDLTADRPEQMQIRQIRCRCGSWAYRAARGPDSDMYYGKTSLARQTSSGEGIWRFHAHEHFPLNMVSQGRRHCTLRRSQVAVN